MSKETKGLKVFLFIAFLFWSILAILTISQINTETNYTEDDLKEIEGKIVYLEQRESNGFYYFRVDSIEDVQFRISEIEVVSFTELETIKNLQQQIIFSVIEDNYRDNSKTGDIEVVSLEFDGKTVITLEEFCKNRWDKLIVRFGVCIFMALGMLASYLYCKKNYL